MREKVLTVTIKDCEVQTFRCGGKGGQNKDKRDTGVRVVHRPSGARGESREERSQLQNKRAAFVRMAKSDVFQRWLHLEHARRVGGLVLEERAQQVQSDAWLEDQLRPENLIIETGVAALL